MVAVIGSAFSFPRYAAVVKNRTTEFDRKRDHEALLARAWGHEVEQQAQRDGAGIANATVVEGVAYFLRAVDLRPGIEDIPSLVISIRAPWLELPVAAFVNTMQTIYQGVLDGIFCQRPIADLVQRAVQTDSDDNHPPIIFQY